VVVFKSGDGTFKAVFKPIKRGRQGGAWESWEAEVVAYKLDQMLGLDMVPPTVARNIKGKKGSVQLWVNDCKLYQDVSASVPGTMEWSHQLTRMKMFDNLILNTDRNARNFMVDPEYHIVLIDHSRAFQTKKDLPKNPTKLPYQFDRELIEKMKALDQDVLKTEFKGLMMGGQIKAILARRDKLVEYMEKQIAEKGEENVIF
jgi:hypothetical protein